MFYSIFVLRTLFYNNKSLNALEEQAVFSSNSLVTIITFLGGIGRVFMFFSRSKEGGFVLYLQINYETYQDLHIRRFTVHHFQSRS